MQKLTFSQLNNIENAIKTDTNVILQLSTEKFRTVSDKFSYNVFLSNA